MSPRPVRWQYERAARDLLAREQTTVPVNTDGQCRIGLVYPGSYSEGMANLGFQVVHRIMGTTPNIGVERFFLPLLSGHAHPPPYYTFEQQRPLGDCAALALSFSFEGQFDAIPRLFGPLGIPIESRRRTPRHPLIIAGGAGVMANPAAISRIADVLVIGEAETCLPPLLQALLTGGRNPLAQIAALPGCWVPAHTHTATPPPPPHPVALAPAVSHIVAPDHAFSGAALFEVMRGCPRACAFCLARCIYHPPRPVPLARVTQIVAAQPQHTAWGLVAPSLFDHPEITPMLAWFAERGLRVRNASAKWEKMSPDLLGLLARCGQDGITLAPESGSARLRALLEKPLDETLFLERINLILTSGFRRIKLYFMVGLPDESDADVQASIDLLSRVAECARGRATQVTASVSGFVPKRGTPLHAAPVADIRRLRRAFATFQQGADDLGGLVECTTENPRNVVRQAHLAQVGPELADEYLETAGDRRQGAAPWADPTDLEF